MAGRAELRRQVAQVGLLARASDWESAILLLGRAAGAGAHDAKGLVMLHSAVMTACSRGVQPSRALLVFERMQQARASPDLIAFNSAVSACSKSSDPAHAQRLLQEARARRLRPDIVTYNAAMSACERGTSPQAAMSLWAELRLARLAPDPFTYGTAVAAFARGAAVASALEMVEGMLRERRALSPVACNAALNACARGSRADRALRLLAEMRAGAVAPDIVSYGAAISACEKGGLPEQALGLLAALRRQRLLPDLVACNAAISACGKAGLWERAQALFWAVAEWRLGPDAVSCNAMVSACEKGWQWEAALLHMSLMSSWRLERNAITCSAAISACEKGRQWEAAMALLREMPEAVIEPGAIAHYAAIRACEVSGQWAKALDLLESMLGARVDPAAANSPDAGWYVHGFEAGGPVDVFKHIVLVTLLQQMAADADPFTFVDMHAGAGVYDLTSEESLRCRWFEEGVLRLSHAADRCGEDLVADYLAAVWRCNRALGASPGALSFYPGSPALAWQWLRPQDSAVLFEAAAEPYEALRRSLALLERGARRRLTLLKDDSYLRLTLGRFSWPKGRQLVLMDPPYDSITSHATWNVFVIRHLLHRAPSSCVALWYPLVDQEQVASLHSRVRSLAAGSVLVAEMQLETSRARGAALQGSGVLVVNPPRAVHARLLSALPGLGGALRASGSRVLWL
ncbi:unnamed protein product [Prorocentrum cordatum]|uniref:Uncharacterized protein n=1 Tax=Prorocentrum cordatum TaxID=2364126 RepID=A0ABN9SLF9_9DINO|nr:unnamed protein product [Polarella glacialis]